MEGILFVIGFYGGLFLIGWIISGAHDLFTKHREKIRNQVAEEVFEEVDMEKVVADYRDKLAHIGHTNNVVKTRYRYGELGDEQIINDIRRAYF